MRTPLVMAGNDKEDLTVALNSARADKNVTVLTSASTSLYRASRQKLKKDYKRNSKAS